MPTNELIIYFIIISVIAVILCCYDKNASKNRYKSRIPEAVLFTVAAMGGSLFMLIAMCIIHHKTKHMSFMIGIPVILLMQAVALVFLHIFVW